EIRLGHILLGSHSASLPSNTRTIEDLLPHHGRVAEPSRTREGADYTPPINRAPNPLGRCACCLRAPTDRPLWRIPWSLLRRPSRLDQPIQFNTFYSTAGCCPFELHRNKTAKTARDGQMEN